MTDEINEELYNLLFESRFSEYERIKGKVTPNRFFKYRDFGENFEYTLDALQKDYLYMSRINTFNDPKDSQMMIDAGLADIIYQRSDMEFMLPMFSHLGLTNEQLNEVMNSDRPKFTANTLYKENRPEIADEIQKEYDEMEANTIKDILGYIDLHNQYMIDHYYVHCLSTTNLSMPMWAFYASNHSGFCIEYDFSVMRRDNWAVKCCYPVFYRDSMFDVTEHFTANGPSPNMHLAASLTKTRDWIHEKEWRIALEIHPPYSLPNNRLPISPAVAIYLGQNAKNDKEEELLKVARQKNLTVYRMSYHNGELRPEIV